MRRARSYHALLEQDGLNCYSVPLSVEGKFYNRIIKETEKRGLSKPVFREKFQSGKGYSIIPANTEYSSIMRSLIADMFTPEKIFNYILNSFEQKRSPENYSEFKKSTESELTFDSLSGLYEVTFSARPGEKPDYHSEASGDTIRESWNDRFLFIIDPKDNLVRKITVRKINIEKDRLTGETISKKSDESRISLLYREFNGRIVPGKLLFTSPGHSRIILEAEYKHEQGYILFKSKSLRFYQSENSAPERAYISYGSYLINSCGSEVSKNKNSSEASDIFTRAQKEVFLGNTKKARKLLEKITEEYRGTIEAREAEDILQSLPR
ncbi:MAG: hypothetical protein ACLFQK_08050 [Fibrobacterota bacterium]